VATGGEDHRIGQQHRPLASAQVEGERAEAGPIGHQQAGDVVSVVDVDAELRALDDQGALDGAPGEVAGVAGAPPPVGAEVPLVEPAVIGPREFTAPVGELEHGGR
jgi:hypothetical protein